MARCETGGCIATVLGGLSGLGLSLLISKLIQEGRREQDFGARHFAGHTGGDVQHHSTKSVVISRDICLVKVHVNVSVHVDHKDKPLVKEGQDELSEETAKDSQGA